MKLSSVNGLKIDLSILFIKVISFTIGVVLNDDSGLANNCLLGETLPSINFSFFSKISISCYNCSECF